MRFVRISEEHDKTLAEIIRDNLKANGLDIPGTVYFDPELDHLSAYYSASPERDYFVALDDEGNVAGGIGLSDFAGLENCVELQKLYLADSVKGHGCGYELIELIINRAKELGYKQMYLETHHNLAAAIHLYEKSGFKRIDKLPFCVHSSMDIFFLKDFGE